MSPESEKDAQARWIIRRDDPICTCKPENPRHNEPWKCVTKEQLAAWQDAMLNTGHYNVIIPIDQRKRLAYLWLHFSQDPEAKRLSGRGTHSADCALAVNARHGCTCDFGLDTWDDAAGMSELEKRMFEHAPAIRRARPR